MHIATKITLGLGVALLIGSVILAVAGGGSTVTELAENPNGFEVWSGTAPDSYEGNFEIMNSYFVFVEDVETVNVTLVGGDEDNRFIPCEEGSNCDYYDWAGHTYVGRIVVFTPGTWEVEFNGTGGVVLTEQDVDLGGALSIFGGIVGFCCSFCVIGLGVIFIFTLKDPQQQQMLLVQQQGTVQPVGASPAQQAVPASHMVAGQIHPAFTQQQAVQQPVVVEQTSGTILPPIGGQQPPNQGF